MNIKIQKSILLFILAIFANNVIADSKSDMKQDNLGKQKEPEATSVSSDSGSSSVAADDPFSKKGSNYSASPELGRTSAQRNADSALMYGEVSSSSCPFKINDPDLDALKKRCY